MSARGPESRPAGAWALAAALFTVAVFWDQRAPARALFIALDAEQVETAARASGHDPADVWERAGLLGVGGALLRPETFGGKVEAAVRRGVPPAVREGTVRDGRREVAISDASLLSRLEDSARRLGGPLPGRRRGGSFSLELPEGVSLSEMPIGYDPGLSARAAARGLTPVYLIERPVDAKLALGGPGAVWLLAPAVWSWEPAQLEALRAQARGARLSWRASALDEDPSARRAAAAFVSAGGEDLLSGALAAAEGPASPGRILRARADGAQLYRIDPDGSAGVEAALAPLRRAARELRRHGAAAGGLPAPSPSRPASEAEAAARAAVAGLLLLAGPIAAVRAGLDTLRAVRRAGAWPEASPVREVAGGMCASAAAAGLAGLGARAWIAGPQWDLGLSPLRLGAWATAVPMAVGFLSLYVPDIEQWGLLFKRPVARGRPWPVVLAVAVAAALLLRPAWPRDWLLAAAPGMPGVWWLAGRSREALFGYPALWTGLWLQHRRIEAAEETQPPDVDSRPWILLGLFGPAGTGISLARAGEPVLAGLAHAAACFALGCALGLALALLREGALALRRAQ